MRLVDLATRIGASLHCVGRGGTITLDQVYAGDRISDLLNAAGEHALLISNLSSSHLLRVAELMDIPGLCFVDGQEPDESLVAAAEEHGTLLMASRCGLFETCGRVYQALYEEQKNG